MIIYLASIVCVGGIFFGSALYFIHLGKKQEQEKQVKDIMNESIKAKKNSVKRLTDSICDIRARVSKYARKD